MRILLATIALFAILGAADRAAAVEYPWCASYSMDGDVSNCGFTTLEQCRMTVTAGTAGLCQRNPLYVAGHAAKPRPATKRRHKS